VRHVPALKRGQSSIVRRSRRGRSCAIPRSSSPDTTSCADLQTKNMCACLRGLNSVQTRLLFLVVGFWCLVVVGRGCVLGSDVRVGRGQVFGFEWDEDDGPYHEQ
jgi:hypothetical protein